jgi:hypothetical protein
MSQMPNPLSPSQFNLTDPTFFLRDLEARKAQYQAQAPAISGGSSRKDTAPKLAVTPTTTGQDPRSRTYDASTASTAARNPVAGLPKDRAMFDQLRAAAEAQYRNEIDAIKLGAMYGATADPLSMRRIGERYTNAIRGIAAQERMAGRRELYRDRIRDRVAAAKTAKAETNAIAADALRRNAERYSTMPDTSAEAVQRKNQEYLDRLVREYRAAPTELAAPAAPAAPAPRAPSAAPIPGPAPVAPPATEPEFVGPATWLQYYRDAPQQEQPGFGQIAQEVRRLAEETPTGQLASVTAPSSNQGPAAPVSTVPPPELLATLPPDQRAYVERELANRKLVEEAGRLGFDPTGYAQIANRPLSESLVRAGDRLLDDLVVGIYNNPVSAPFRPGTGVLGAPLPAELSQREVDLARTPEERAAAEARQTQAAMQGGLQDLLGGAAAGIRGPAGPAPAPVRAQPVVDNPMLQGQTDPTMGYVNPSQVSGWRPAINKRSAQARYSPNQPIPGMGDWYTPQATTQVTPGQPGQIVDMPVPQGTARTNPYQAGLPEATVPATGPMGSLVRDVDPLSNLVPSTSPIGSSRPPYPATVETPSGQRLLPGFTNADVPPLPVAPRGRGIMEPQATAPVGDIPGQSMMFENLPAPAPVVPRQIREAREVQRRVSEGRAANEQIARQLARQRETAEAAAPQVDPALREAVTRVLDEIAGGTKRLGTATKRGIKGAVEGYKSARAETKKKAEGTANPR